MGHTKQRDRFYLEQRLSFSVKSMLVRVKRVGSRRYAYLVIGRKKGERARQKTVFYLGPISKLVYGVPIDTRRKVRRPFRVDWDKIEDNIARIPLSFEELSEARHTEYFMPSWARPKGFPARDPKPRAPGELSALIELAAKKFDEMFEEIGDREYRMR